MEYITTVKNAQEYQEIGTRVKETRMAKVTLEDGRVIDALALVESKIRDYMQLADRLVEESKDGTREHRRAVMTLKNCLYFLSLTVEELPKRTYKQPRPQSHLFP